MSTSSSANRRDFLKGAGSVTTVALTIGFQWLGPSRAAALAAPSTVFAPNAFLRIGADGSVTVIAKHLEMGQGTYTGLATVLAEELDADWARVRVESAPADVKRYVNFAFGMQGTGGSSAMANSWTQLREAGAKGRAMLLSAAAREWKVPVSELTAEKGVVYHPATTRQATYGSLVAKAAALPVPDKVTLKGPEGFQVDRAEAGAGGRAGQGGWHGAVHARRGPAGHVGCVAQATTLVRGNGEVL